MGLFRGCSGCNLIVLVLAIFMLFPLCCAKYERPAISRLSYQKLQSLGTGLYPRARLHSGSLYSVRLLTKSATPKIVQDRDMNKRKEACYIDIDNGLWGRGCRSSIIAKENCALRCVSAACYNTIYGEDPLEEGEVDIKRGRDFRQCLRREIQEEKRLSTD